MKKLARKWVWLSPKRNFLKKVAFWAQAKYISKTRWIYGPLRSINQNALLAFWTLLPLDACIYENAPNISHKLTHLISLLFTPHALTPTPPSLACISALCSALYSVVSFFLSFFFLSSSSSTRFWSCFFFFLILFLSNLIWEIRFEGRDLLPKHQATLICYQKSPGTN